MSYKISKKLFEAVMSVGLYDELYIDNYFDEYNGIEIEDWQIIKYNNTWIPLDTFVFKCKEWALKQGYYITSDLIEVNIHPIEYGAVKMKSILCIDIVDNINEWELNEHHLASSEQQAVFDACQWILENKDKQCLK